MAVEFRYANPSEYPQLAKCLNDYWAVNHIYVRHEPLFQWTFNRRDVWEHDSLSFSVAEDKGEMVGILGGIPFWFNNRGQRSKGVWIEGVCVTSYRLGVEVSIQRTNGYEIVIGTQRIRSPENPQAHLEDIKRWLRWYFLEFVPTVPTSPRPMAESRHRMWQLSKVACPECGRALAPCPGDLGVAIR